MKYRCLLLILVVVLPGLVPKDVACIHVHWYGSCSCSGAPYILVVEFLYCFCVDESGISTYEMDDTNNDDEFDFNDDF
jgi:hypothetical protein